jgi:hypothetical protein
MISCPVLLTDINQHMRDSCLESWFGLYVDTNYCEYGISSFNLSLKLEYPFGLVGVYKSIYERCSSWIMIQPPHGYKLLCAWKKIHQVFKNKSMFASYASYIHVQIKSYHALDLVLLVVTNRSMRDVYQESRFGPHIDTNYCTYGNIHLASHIQLLS